MDDTNQNPKTDPVVPTSTDEPVVPVEPGEVSEETPAGATEDPVVEGEEKSTEAPVAPVV